MPSPTPSSEPLTGDLVGRFVGIDLAWSTRARTGVAVVDDAGALLASGVVRTEEELDVWLDAHAPSPVVVGIDAPIVVPNASGMREAEKAVSRVWGRYGAGAYPAHRGFAWFDPPRAEVLAQRRGWRPDPALAGSLEEPVALEVYPHPAMVALFGLERVLPYKAKKGRPVDMRRAVFLELLDHLEALPELRLPESRRWAEIRAVVDAATRQVDLERVEDEIDAVLCAHLAWRWRHRRGSLVVHGDAVDGFVVVPPAPG